MWKAVVTLSVCFAAVIEEADKNGQNCVHAELHTDLEKQMVRTDQARLLSLFESLAVSTVDTEFTFGNNSKTCGRKIVLLVRLLEHHCKERLRNKTAMIRNENKCSLYSLFQEDIIK